MNRGQGRRGFSKAQVVTFETTRPSAAVGVVLAFAGIIAATPAVAPSPDARANAVRLTSADTADSPLGDGIALAMGGSGLPVPVQRYADSFDQLYLAPRGFTGTAQPLFTPEGLAPLTGVNTLTLNESEAQGEQIIEQTVHRLIDNGQASAENPAVLVGWSQSSAISALVMPQLAADGVPSDDVHFLLVGDTSAPNGGMLARFDVPEGSHPTIPALGITFTGAQPNDLYPTDVYTLEYDGFADYPQYPINWLSDLNAIFGIIFEHLGYLGVTPDQIADAIQLPTSAADTLTNYYMMPANSLPLLDPLLFLPVVGKPLYDLLEPDMRVLVNLGYGSIANGWSPGDADVTTPFGLLPPLSVLQQVPEALATGLQQGITAAIVDLQNPATYQVSEQAILDQPFLQLLIDSGFGAGLLDTTHPTLAQVFQGLSSQLVPSSVPDNTGLPPLTGIVNDLTAAVAAGQTAMLPIQKIIDTLLTTLPAYDLDLFTDQLQAGNLLDAIGDPIAANTGLTQIALTIGVLAPLATAIVNIGADLNNATDLIPDLFSS